MPRVIAISSGHGKYVLGATPPYMDEVTEARRVVAAVADELRKNNMTFRGPYNDDTSRSQNENLNRIVNWHNGQSRDLDVSVHFNANKATSSPMGTECLYVTQSTIAKNVSAAVAEAGDLKNRGPKYNGGLFFLNNTNKPAILIEVCFVDSSADKNLYNRNFVAICSAIAREIAGYEASAPPVEPPVEPPEGGGEVPIEPPPEVSKPRPMIGQGDNGYNVEEVQRALGADVDGDFGPQTKDAVMSYQARKNLSVDGIVGDNTWAALTADHGLPPYPYPLPELFNQNQINTITGIAINSAIAGYSWRDRGRAPAGYTKGMALAYAQAVMRWNAGDPIAKELGKANTGNDAIDALSWYNSNFSNLGMRNDETSLDTLRHLYVLLLGLGMRESSGKHCEGRDMSASNTSSTTAEAGMFQTSFNASSACTDFLNLFDSYEIESPQGYMDVFAEGVSCNSSSWSCYGSGDGLRFQKLAKYDPTFAVETCGITLRNLRQHYGPINRKEAELRREADEMFIQVERALGAEV